MKSLSQAVSLGVALGVVAISSGAKGAVTFSRDVAPVVFEHCAGCHRPGQAGPFSLLSFADVKKRAGDIVKVTGERSMPPWLAEKGMHAFVGDRRLSGAQIELIARWVAEGAVEGDVKDLPVLPKFPGDWELGTPDLVVKMEKPYALAGEGRDLYRNFVVRAPVGERRFVRAMEFRSRNRAVHHVRVTLDSTRQSRRLDALDAEAGFAGMKTPGKFPPGHLLSWVPGIAPRAVEDGLQWVLEKETDLVLEMHLQRTGKEEMVDPEIGLYFTNAPPSRGAVVMGLTSQLVDIAAGETNYVVEREAVLPVDCFATSILPHAHYLAKEWDVFAVSPRGEKESLLRILDWDFNWQGEYRFERPVLLTAGTKLGMRARFDNSEGNVRNPNRPARRVVYGPQSTDEMCEVWIQLLPRNGSDLAQLQRAERTVASKETIALYEKRLKENPRDAAVHLALGKVLGPMGAMDAALRHFQMAIELDEAMAEAHLYVGLALMEKRDFDGAQKKFEESLKHDPSSGKAHAGLGVVAMGRNRVEEARRHFQRALEINPDDAASKIYLQRLGQTAK